MIFGRRHIAVFAAAALAASLPCASAQAGSSGGASPDEAPSSAPAGAPTPLGTLAIGTPVATSSANGITISSESETLLRTRARVTGVAPVNLGEVRIEQLDARRGWSAVATAEVEDDGTFAAVWRPRAAGPQQLRAVAASSASRVTQAAPQVGVTVYRTSTASWYGPGFWGRQTACGLKLRKTTLGVAHKTLPCGTQVKLLYSGRTLTVPVIDRGPFVKGRAWDLTKATLTALGGIDGLLTVGAQPLTDEPALKTPFKAPPIKG